MSAAKDLCSIDHHKFTLVRPFVGAYNQFGTNRILAHVIPFLAVTLVGQPLITTLLPTRPSLHRLHLKPMPVN